jgi:hypothetical protein
MDIPDEAWAAAGEAVLRSEAIEAVAPIIAAPLQARIAELEAKLAESERISGILRDQRNAAEDELRALGRDNPWSARAAQVAVLRELLGADDPNFQKKSARDLVLSFMDKLSELESGAGQAEVRDGE